MKMFLLGLLAMWVAMNLIVWIADFKLIKIVKKDGKNYLEIIQ